MRDENNNMNDIDLVAMLGNFAKSLDAVIHLVTGLSYLTGLMLVTSGIFKLKKDVSSGAQSKDSHFGALSLIVMGSLLLFFPTTVRVLSYSMFGTENILQYAHFNRWDIYKSIGVLLQFAGVFWFVRGCIMVVHASSPGEQHGLKGLFYIISGVLSMNFTLTMGAVAYVIDHLIGLSISFKK
jgi:hypothetical protein